MVRRLTQIKLRTSSAALPIQMYCDATRIVFSGASCVPPKRGPAARGAWAGLGSTRTSSSAWGGLKYARFVNVIPFAETVIELDQIYTLPVRLKSEGSSTYVRAISSKATLRRIAQWAIACSRSVSRRARFVFRLFLRQQPFDRVVPGVAPRASPFAGGRLFGPSGSSANSPWNL
jgi:hypothetical protein